MLELSETNQWIPENTKLTNVSDLGFSLDGEPRPNLFVNTELYSARKGAVQKCVECADDSVCGQGNYWKDWGPTPPSGLCQQCNVNDRLRTELSGLRAERLIVWTAVVFSA